MENNYVEDILLGKISRELNIRVSQIRAVLKLLEEGATVPFIARYRKEATGNLDEEQIRAIYQEWDYGQKLYERKEAVLKAIEQKGKLTDEIRNAILESNKLSEIEDMNKKLFALFTSWLLVISLLADRIALFAKLDYIIWYPFMYVRDLLWGWFSDWGYALFELFT